MVEVYPRIEPFRVEKKNEHEVEVEKVEMNENEKIKSEKLLFEKVSKASCLRSRGRNKAK